MFLSNLSTKHELKVELNFYFSPRSESWVGPGTSLRRIDWSAGCVRWFVSNVALTSCFRRGWSWCRFGGHRVPSFFFAAKSNWTWLVMKLMKTVGWWLEAFRSRSEERDGTWKDHFGFLFCWKNKENVCGIRLNVGSVFIVETRRNFDGVGVHRISSLSSSLIRYFLFYWKCWSLKKVAFEFLKRFFISSFIFFRDLKQCCVLAAHALPHSECLLFTSRALRSSLAFAEIFLAFLPGIHVYFSSSCVKPCVFHICLGTYFGVIETRAVQRLPCTSKKGVSSVCPLVQFFLLNIFRKNSTGDVKL